MIKVICLFSASNKSCDEFLEQPFGYISSPDQDRDGFYDYNLKCIWTVQVAENYVIGFHVFHVDIQYCDKCRCKDFVKVCENRIIRKTSYCKHQEMTSRKQVRVTKTPYTPVLYSKTGVYWGKHFFLFLLQNIDCGYSLEPPH